MPLTENTARFAEELPVWTGEPDDRLICRRVVQETHDMRSFTFTPPTPQRFRFLPGQFITFAFEIAGEQIHRCYTIASPPTRPYAITITVKRVPDRPVSTWLHETMRPGTTVRATAPLGDFSAALHPSPKYLFLSGGSGITPLVSMSRAAGDLAAETDIIFVHSARSPADIPFREELALLARALPGFRPIFVCENDSAQEIWGGYRGRLSAAMLRLIAPDAAEREVFTCGPTPYMDSVRAIVVELGCNPARYHQESFVFEDIVQEAAPIAQAVGSFKIAFAKTGRTIECTPDTAVLAAARAAGLRLPASCTQGMCGTCKSKLLSGKVDLKHQGGIRQREIDQGWTLLCCARPRSDLVVDR